MGIALRKNGTLTPSVATGNLRPKPKSQVDKPCGRDMAKKKGGIGFALRPLTPDLWPALQDLFGKSGASNGCWCMYWRLEGDEVDGDAFKTLIRVAVP